jgi:hypothetical protein
MYFNYSVGNISLSLVFIVKFVNLHIISKILFETYYNKAVYNYCNIPNNKITLYKVKSTDMVIPFIKVINT